MKDLNKDKYIYITTKKSSRYCYMVAARGDRLTPTENRIIKTERKANSTVTASGYFEKLKKY